MTDALTLLCVHPHPDDESISCGGVLARAADAGIVTVVVTCTDGEEGENLAGIDLGDRDLVTHRHRELADALAILGVDRHHRLGYRDSGMAGSAANEHPDSFHSADRDEAALRLATVIRTERPHVVVSDDEQGGYGHPDHVAANRVTARAVELAADPDAALDGAPWSVVKRYVHTFARGRLAEVHQRLLAAGHASPFGDDPRPDAIARFGVEDAEITTEVDVRPWLAVKRRAIAAHRSQIGADSLFIDVPDELATQLFGLEQYALRDGPRPHGEIERDLFVGVAPQRFGPDEFRDVMGRLPTGVAVMTTVLDGHPHGMTVNAVTSVSLEPPLVAVCVERGTVMAGMLGRSRRFGLSFLVSGQASRSAWFSDPSRPIGEEEFANVAWRTHRTGVPLLDESTGWLECRIWAEHDGGDHVIVLGEVVALGEGGHDDPLVFHRGGYGRFTPERP